LGRPIDSGVEDAALLTGAWPPIDDLGFGRARARAILRSPHAHAEILSIDLAAALRGRRCCGPDRRASGRQPAAGVGAVNAPIAVGRCGVGNQFAVVVASDNTRPRMPR
jgi:2-furoyl-CoA dehydrogenase large subunit